MNDRPVDAGEPDFYRDGGIYPLDVRVVDASGRAVEFSGYVLRTEPGVYVVLSGGQLRVTSAGGVHVIQAEPPRCPYCLRERDADDAVFITWAENNCKNWAYCPANFGQPS